MGFDLYEGTNFFGDEFSVLYTSVPVERYVELSELTADPQARSEFLAVAQVDRGQVLQSDVSGSRSV